MILLLLLGLLTLASPAWATVYYVSGATGNNGNNCIPNSPGTPMQTIQKGITCLQAGDTLYLRAGTYNTRIYVGDVHIPSGTSWSNAVTIAGYPGDGIYPAVITQGIDIVANLDGSAVSFVIFDNLEVYNTGAQGVRLSGNSHDIRISNSNLYTLAAQPALLLDQAPMIVFIGGGNDGHQVLNCKVHDAPVTKYPGVNLTAANYGFYAGGTHMLIEGNEIYNNAGYGIHHFCSGCPIANNNIIRNNYFHGNGYDDGTRANLPQAGLVLESGYHNQVYNNVFENNNSGIQMGCCDDNQIYNNTFIGNTAWAVSMNGSTSNPIIRNNIFYQNGASDTIVDSGAVGIIAADHNLAVTNPQFTNAAAHDYTLQAGSPAIDAGVPIAAFAVDKLLVARPQGAAWDRGAYEFVGGGGPPAPGPQALRWQFDEGAGATVADATGNGYTGTLTGGPSWGPGRVGSGAVTLDGASQYVTTGSLVWTAGQPVTVLLWRKVTTGTVAGAFGVHSSTIQDNFGAHLPYSDNVCYWDYGNRDTTGRISVDCTPYLGRWMRLALVSSGNAGTFKGIYINGALVASAAASGAPTTDLTTLDVGRWINDTGTLYAPGSVDDFRLDNRVWSAAEILTDYRRGALVRRHRVSLR